MLPQDYKTASGNILGIIAIILSLFLPFASLILGIIGLVQCSKQKGRFAKRGRTLNIIAIILSVILIAVSVYLYISGGDLLSGVA